MVDRLKLNLINLLDFLLKRNYIFDKQIIIA